MDAKFALVGAIAARVPAISVSVRSFPEFKSTAFARGQRKAIMAMIGSASAVSRHVASNLTRVLGWPPSKVRVVYPGVDLRDFDIPPDSRLRAELSKGTTRKVIIAVARLDPIKGLDTLIAAAIHLPHAQIVIVGDGSEKARLQRQASDLGVADRITFLGHRTDVPDLLLGSDVLAMPSFNEGLGRAAIEAMAASRPVVASTVGGLPESIVPGETGLLVPPGDPGALADALTVVLEDQRLARDMGAAGRRRVAELFTLDRSTEGTTAMWTELLAKTCSRPEALEPGCLR